MRGGTFYQYFGDTKTDIDAVHALWGGPSYVEMYNSGASAWTPGKWLMIDLTAVATYGNPGCAIEATAALQKQCIGIAVDAPTQGQRGRVQLYGKYASASVEQTGGTAGLFLTMLGAAAAGVPKFVAANGGTGEYPNICGFILTTASGALADVFVLSPWARI